jgi:predicted O-methyltransferase YrrM
MNKFDSVTEKLGTVKFMDATAGSVMRDMILENGAKSLLEIGFCSGKSSAYMGATLEDRGGDGHLTTIDRRQARKNDPDIHTTLATVGLTHRVTPIFAYRSYTWEIAKMLKQDPRPQFDLCYFDGGHTWDLTGFGLLLVDMLLRPGGLIVIDDLNWTVARAAARRNKAYAAYDDDERAEKPVLLAWNTIIPHLGYERSYANSKRWGVARKPAG